MRINIFRNPHIDAQVGYLLDSMIDARRKETEEYWRSTITDEIKKSLVTCQCGGTNVIL